MSAAVSRIDPQPAKAALSVTPFRAGTDSARPGSAATASRLSRTANVLASAGASRITRQVPEAGRERLRVAANGPAPFMRAAGGGTITVGGPGAPLAADVRERLEAGFGADLGAVRVHEGAPAARLALGHGARAFAFGHHVVLGAGESSRDLAMMAHEVAHVLQQRGASAVQRCGAGSCYGCGAGGTYEAEAARAAATVSGGGSYTVTGQATAGTPQFEGEDEGLLTSAIWSAVEAFAPKLMPIIRRGPEGVLDWVKEQVTGALKSLIDTAMAPVRGVADTGKWLQGHVGPLLQSMQDAAAKIAQNDCKPITDAAQKIEDVATRLITPVIEKLQLVVGKVGDFLKGVWDKFGVPVWDFIKKYAGEQWEALQQLGDWIWAKTARVRELGQKAWNWLKNKIGIGEGPEGQNGILQWIQGKASAAWDWVQAKIAPYKKQITAVAATIAGVAVMISPAGPIVLAGAAIYGAIQGVRWIRANLGGGNAIVRARAYAQGVLIPQLIGSIGKMTAAITKMAGAVTGKLRDLAAGFGQVVGAAASTALKFLVDAAQWVADKASELAAWAAEKLAGLADWIQRTLGRLLDFLQPLLDFFGKVGSLIVDIYALPGLLAGALWKKIPACIRDPFVDWIVPLILGQIEIFRELVKTPEAWTKTKADVMNIVRMVFITKDLKGAIRATFDLLLRMFNVPLELLVQIKQKAVSAWDTISKAPIAFIKNAVRALGRGLKMYWDHLKDNLLNGLEGWLFNELADKGIAKPKSWTDPWDLVRFALDVMGLSMPHIFDLMEKRFPKEMVDKLRAGWRLIVRAWDWILDMKDKKPGEVTKEIIKSGKEYARSVLEGIVVWIVEQVAVELSKMATAAAATAGLSEALDAVKRIYRAIKTAVRWARLILDMVNRTLDSVLDIAAGSLQGPAEILLGAMQKATPAVIGFFGDQVGLGSVADEIKQQIDKLRAKVDDAILAIIDAVRALFGAVVAGAKRIAAKVFEWWKLRRKVGEGEETHTLSIQGDEDTAELYIESTPRLLTNYLDGLEKKPDYGGAVKAKIFGRMRKKIDFFATLKKELRAARNANKTNVASSKEEAIHDTFEDIGDELGKLFEGGKYGTENEPIPIAWPGPSVDKYPLLYFGGRLPTGRRPKSQGALKAIYSKGQRDETDNFVLEYRPQKKQALRGGEEIGLDSEFFVKTGVIVGPLSTDATPGGGKLERLIAPYGFSSDGDNMQLDHVHEIQFGGVAQNDKVENLWPLLSILNSIKGSKLSRAEVEYPKGTPIRIPTLKAIQNEEVAKRKKFFFKITSTE
ncbi:hypothetical protein CBA19CS11_29375 [Caballeronia novacaledonica]|uniref:eCIS core domain-containing protein n=1 Tax=Caballeronia novacaledonica TaxID=1544861 RepID=UPI001EE1DDAD|nr:DUF4157 domain-containing protein [Caballeronia novacaledonica]GJH13035.1 hypothetical protein CBA19CS11_29375 [Caballeronia novacaledonica]